MSPFSQHAFISYAHLDNNRLPTEQDSDVGPKRGWVALLHETLQQLLAGRLGAQAVIWRDPKLQGNDIFGAEILGQFPGTAAVVAVVSPRYLKSEWCAKELAAFCEAAQQTGGVVIGNKSRVFKIIKLPVERRELPPLMDQMLGYEFFEVDGEVPRELDPAYGEKAKQEFLKRAAKLAWDMKLLIEELERGGAAAAGSGKPTVYLAETSRDQRAARETLSAELARLGYPVVPDRELPRDEDAYLGAVDQLLTRSQLAVHIVGSSGGAVPDGASGKSVVVLQNEAAARHSTRRGLPRVMWLPEGTTSTQPAHAVFIEALHRDANAQRGGDLITGDVEMLKGAVHSALKKVEDARRAPPPPAATPGRPRIHLLCDERDRQAAVPLLRALGRAADFTLPVFTGGAAEVREANQALLMACDTVVLFYGAGDEVWKFHQQNDLRRVRALRADRPLPPETLYLAGPRTDDKATLAAVGGEYVIDAIDAFPDAAVAALIARARS